MGKMSKYVRMAMNADRGNMRGYNGNMRGGMRNEARYDYDSRYEDGYESTYEPRYEMESLRGRRRNSRGRFMRSEMEDDDGMNTIGFYTGGDEIRAPYDMEAGHKGRAEMEWRGGEMQKGHGKAARFNHETAMKWTKHMKNGDGSTGAHWTLEQVRKVMRERGIRRDEASFFAVLNAIYSDYCVVFKDHGLGDDIDFYVEMACAWLDDEDAVEDKAGAYYECIVKH